MTRYQRAQHVWSLLIVSAMDRKSFTYSQVGKILGVGGGNMVSQYLKPVMNYCEKNGYPPLTVMVVNKETGLPGEGLTTVDNVNQDREAVYCFDWFSVEWPTESDFENTDK